LRIRKAGLRIGPLPVAADQAIEVLQETWIIRIAARIAEAAGDIRALEVVALEADLFRGIVVAQLAAARIAEDAVTSRIYEAGGQERRGTGLSSRSVERQAQIDRNAASQREWRTGERRSGITFVVSKELIEVNGRLGDKAE
jgi:hypothetical protein